MRHITNTIKYCSIHVDMSEIQIMKYTTIMYKVTMSIDNSVVHYLPIYQPHA